MLGKREKKTDEGQFLANLMRNDKIKKKQTKIRPKLNRVSMPNL